MIYIYVYIYIYIAEDRSQANILQQRCMNMLLLAGTLFSGRPLTSKHITTEMHEHAILLAGTLLSGRPLTSKHITTEMHEHATACRHTT